MRIGQTSAFVFVAKLLGSFLGFVATIYFARVVGAEVLGYYAAALAILAWLKFVSTSGVQGAIKKRLSEGQDSGAYLSAGVSMVVALTALSGLLVLLLRDPINAYVGEDVALYIILILISVIGVNLVFAILKGQRDVHISEGLRPVKIGLQSVIQIALVFVGYGLAGMLVGYAIGALLVFFIGTLYVTIFFSWPNREHFVSLFDYAKFSWLGKLESRTINDIDIVILTALVSPALVGIYSVAWTLSKFLMVFGSAIRSSLFPEISYRSANDRDEEVKQLITDSLTYTGLIAIPGVVGGLVLSERLMLMYGSEFVEGATVLVVLIFAILVQDYYKQLANGLNGIDRPDIVFYINAIVIAVNVILNVVLIFYFGIFGAAVASVTAVAVGFILSLQQMTTIIDVRSPATQIGEQVVAAVLMGVVVFGADQLLRTGEVSLDNLVVLAILVPFGAAVYFVTLFAMSAEFRSVVQDNVPERFPLRIGGRY